MEFSHIPVLLQPCLDGLNIDPAGIYLDGTAGGAGHSALAVFLKEHQVETLICGGIGGGAQMALAQAGIRLCGGITGDADSAAAAYLAGTLVFDPNARCTHHDHEEGHSCGSHACHADKGGCTGSCH